MAVLYLLIFALINIYIYESNLKSAELIAIQAKLSSAKQFDYPRSQ